MGGPERNVSIIIKARNEADKALASLGRNLTSLPVLAAAAAASLAAVGAILSKVTMAAAEQEKADVRLATALASIGQNTAPVRARLAEFISTLQDVTTVGDETISGVVSTFAQLGQLTGDALEQATQAALDYAAATGQDVQTAATQMVNVLVKGSGRLQGIATDFDTSASKGDRFAAVIEQINSKMGGAAAVTGKTFSGALQRIANDYDDLMQETGRAVVENEAFRGVLEAVSVILKEATGFVSEHSDAFQTLVTVLSRAALGMVKIAAEVTAFEFRLISMGLSLGQVLVSLVTLADDAPALVKKIFGWTDEDSIALAKWAGQWMTSLGNIKGAFGEAGDSADVVAAKIKNIIDGLGKGSGKTKVAETIQGVGAGAAAATTEMQLFASVLEELGIPALDKMEQAALNVDDALMLLAQLNQAGLISPEQWDAVLGAITEITHQLPQWGDDLSAAQTGAQATLLVMTDMEEALQQNLTGAADSFGGALIDAAMGAKIAWGQFFRQLLADLIKAIIRATVIQAIFKALGFAFGGPAGAQAAGLAAHTLFDAGGHGGFGGEAAMSLATPSPISLSSAGSVGAFGLASAGASVPLRPEMSMPITILPRRDKTAEAIDMLEEIRVLVERRGYYLPATAVVG